MDLPIIVPRRVSYKSEMQKDKANICCVPVSLPLGLLNFDALINFQISGALGRIRVLTPKA